MVKLLVGPLHITVPIAKCGVTTMFAVIGNDPILAAVNEMMSPAPIPDKPMAGRSFVQEYVAVPPVLRVVKVTKVVG